MTVVAGVDGSASARAALMWAIEEARSRETSVLAVHAVPRPWATGAAGGPYGAYVTAGMRGQLEARGGELLAHEIGAALATAGEGVEVEGRMVEGPAAAALLRESEDAEMLVVGSRGHGGFASLLLGSVGHQCAEHARCPVVVVRGRVDLSG